MARRARLVIPGIAYHVTQPSRPHGSVGWLQGLERKLGRVLQPQKRGRKRKKFSPR